jgi:DNA-directed RNA polymerase II subunit RPB2
MSNISEKYIRDVLSNYFKNSGFVRHQIDSFNNFISDGIERVISKEADIVINKPCGQKYIIKFGQVNIQSPSYIEEERISKDLFPSEARIKDLTYESPVFVDITETFEDGDVKEVNVYKRVMIAKIPTMLKSNICNLNKCTYKERIKKGECEYDQGGYFIIKGKERVLIAQIRGIYNKSLVIQQKSNDKYKYVAEVRSMSEETGHSALVQAKIGNDNRTIVFSLPYIKEDIPVGIVFKALGYTEDEDIIKLININSDKINKYIKIITRDSYCVKNQEEALSYIGKYSIHSIKEEKQKDYALQVVETELFPHMGILSSIKEKVFFLADMINKLLSTHLGLRTCDDRDNYINKRVESAGILCCDLFRTLFKRYIKTTIAQLEKKKYKPDILSIISRNNSITTGLKHSFSTGNWGIQKNSYVRTGVSQVLARYYGAALSHLRRLAIPIGKEGKNTKIRQINPSQIMFICPSETPEGQSTGIVLNLALLTNITTRIDNVLVREILENISLLKKIDDYDGIVNNQTNIFLNGIIIGITEDPINFVNIVKSYRRSGLLNKQISVAYDTIDNEIRIFSDEGRLIRPLFTLKNNQLTLNENYSRKWNELVHNNYIEYLDNYEVEHSVIAMTSKSLTKYHHDYLEISPSMMLGVMASIIPFPDHSQSPRNCYQSSMGKQAMGIFALSHKIRTDTIVHVLDYPQKPLVSTMSSEFLGFNDMPSGINAIVAIACYSGFNQEDSLILNQSAIERGLFSTTSYRTLCYAEKRKGNSTETICIPPLDIRKKDSNYYLLDSNGIVKKGVPVKKGDVIIGKMIVKINKSNNTEEKIDTSLTIKGTEEEGIVDRIIDCTSPNGYKLIKIVIRHQRIPEVGDKFASRAAQKGICGMVFRQEDMPFTADGIVPDIIMNPHAIPSRMTINQLMECVLGKSCSMKGKLGDATPFTSNSVNIAEILCENLSKCGFERHSLEQMYNGFTGEPIKARIYIGPTYYQRLKHMVSDKIHSRSTGHVTTLTRQPLEGRARDGGLRFGEMERDCMIAHGVSLFLKERLFYQSDPYQVVICDNCGCITSSPTECKACKNDKVSKVNLPYAAKLLILELNTMGIKTMIKSKN